MSDVELDYRYLASSSFDPTTSSLDLATSGGAELSGLTEHPRFFSGFFTQPPVAAEGLRAVGRIGSTSYVDRSRPRFSDPVVTSDGKQLRFESFSACGGVYARLDVLPSGVDGDNCARGTTNVDINEPLRRLLAGISPEAALHVSVGRDELAISDATTTVVERRIALPERWIRGFAESQRIASGFDLRLELSAVEATRFVRTVTAARSTGWVLPAGRGARVSGRATAQAVFIGDGRRLEALVPLLQFATRLRAYGPVATEGIGASCSGWEVELPGARFVLLLSPSPWRGFSGEGATLELLAGDQATGDAGLVHAALDFQPRLDVSELARAVELTSARVRAAMACLASAGQVGYDLAEAGYFHRELPYDAAMPAEMNPRLRAARDVVATGSVAVIDETTAEVASGETRYRVWENAAGAHCTCTWWTSHQGARGPCKHVLAVHIQRNRNTGEAVAHADDCAGVAADPRPPRTS